jgi:allantoinase
MPRTHGRYAYSNITKGPDYSWPGGKRLAVYVAVKIEQFSYNEGKGAGLPPPEQSNTRSTFSWRDYGNRVGMWRLLELFDELDIPAEAQMNAATYEHCPDILQKTRARR